MEREQWKQFDVTIVLVILGLVAYGLLMIYSATFRLSGSPVVDSRVYQQAIYAVLGLGILVVGSLVNYRLYGSLAWPLYLLAVGILGAVLVIGQVTHGSQRWVDLGFFRFQPSEPAKLLLILALGKYLSDRENEMHRFRPVAISLALTLVPLLLTFLQPDLATAAVFVVVWAGMAGMAGMRLVHGVGIVLASLVALPVTWLVLHDYQRARLLIFLGLQSDPSGKQYNAIQALIGVGSGGWFGRGFTSGTQSQLHFLRVQYSDYIFSVLAEELGFVGAVALFALFLFLLWRIMAVVAQCPDSFGRLVGTGVVMMLAFQTFVNAGMNIGLLPVAGVTLPFISYGGSSLLTAMAAVGLVQSVAIHQRPERR